MIWVLFADNYKDQITGHIVIKGRNFQSSANEFYRNDIKLSGHSINDQ